MALQTSDLPMLPPGQDPFSPQEVYTRSLLELHQKRQKEDQQIAQNHQLLQTAQQFAGDQSGMLSPSTQGQWKRIHGELALAAYDNPTKAPDKDTLAEIQQLHQFTQGELMAKQQSIPPALQPPPAQVAPGPQVGISAGMLPQGAQQQTAAAQGAQASLPPPPGAQPKPPGIRTALKGLIPLIGGSMQSADVSKYKQQQDIQTRAINERAQAAQLWDQVSKDDKNFTADQRARAAALALRMRSDQPEDYTQPFSQAVGAEHQALLQQITPSLTPPPSGEDFSLSGQLQSTIPSVRTGAEAQSRGAGLAQGATAAEIARLKQFGVDPSQLTPTQRAEIATTGKVTPDMTLAVRNAPGVVPGNDPSIQSFNPDPNKSYRVTTDRRGNPVSIMETVLPPDIMMGRPRLGADGQVEYPLISRRTGQEISTEQALFASQLPTQRTTSSEQMVLTQDGPVMVPKITTSVTQRVTPAQQGKTSPAILPPPPGASAPAPARGGGARPVTGPGGTPLNPPLADWAKKTIAESTPVLQQLRRAKALLEPLKDTDQPLQFAIDRLGYAVGKSTQYSDLISNLELGKVVGASRVLKGSSRALPALEIAMQHLPDPKKDSAKLMYQKLQNIEQNLMDITNDAKKFGGKWGNIPPPEPGPLEGGAQSKIDVISPEGVPGQIPADKWPEAEKRGFKRK